MSLHHGLEALTAARMVIPSLTQHSMFTHPWSTRAEGWGQTGYRGDSGAEKRWTID